MACALVLVAPEILEEIALSSNVSQSPPYLLTMTYSWFDRTLERLGRLRQRVEQQPTLRPRQSRAILTKLEQHEAKLADLASKYSVSIRSLLVFSVLVP